MASPSSRAVTTTETRGFTVGRTARVQDGALNRRRAKGDRLRAALARRVHLASYPDALAPHSPDVDHRFVNHQVGVTAVRRADDDEIRALPAPLRAGRGRGRRSRRDQCKGRLPALKRNIRFSL